MYLPLPAGTATEPELKTEQLSKTHHPDLNPTNKEQAARRMQELSEAYTVLSDESQRRKYDASINKYVYANQHQQHSYNHPSAPSMNIHRHRTATYAWKNAKTHNYTENSTYRRKDMPGFMSSSSSTSSSFVHEAQRQARRAALHAERTRRNRGYMSEERNDDEKDDSWSSSSRFLMVISILGFVQFVRVVFT